MAQVGYAVTTEGAVALTATTAKTILGARAGASFAIQLKEFVVGFDGVTASDAPVLVELCSTTFATNPPGTNSTSVTVQNPYGRQLTAGSTAAKNWTTEPTVITVIKSSLVTPNGGLLVFQFPLGMEPDTALQAGFSIRCTAPTSAVNVRAAMTFERV